MKRDCLNCGQKEMVHTVRDVPYTYKGHHTVIFKVKGWHCFHCREVEFDVGEGVRFAEAIKQVAGKIDAKAATAVSKIAPQKCILEQGTLSDLPGPTDNNRRKGFGQFIKFVC